MFNFKNINKINISVPGNVRIKTHKSEELEVKINDEDKEKVNIYQTNSKLNIEIKQEKTTIKGLFGNIFNNNSNINIQSGNIIINGVSNSNFTPIKMEIYVPENTIKSINLSGQVNIDIENVSEKLSVDASGQCKIDLDNINTVILDMSGQSIANIKDSKYLTADLSGQCRVHLESLDIERLIIDASGQSNVNVNSKNIKTVEADLSGMCNAIIFGKVTNKDIYTSGMSNVEFK